MRYALHRGVALSVLTSARTVAQHHEELGCSIQGPTARPIRRALAPLKRAVAELGREGALERARELIRWVESTPRYDALCRGRTRRLGRRVLRDDVLFPDPDRLRPHVLHLRRLQQGLDVPVAARDWPVVSELFATLSRGASPAELRAFGVLPATSELLEALREAGWLVRAGARPAWPAPGAVFVGHNTVLVQSQRARVLVDPYFRPSDPVDLPGYQPVHPRDLGPVDAVLITHTHGDHFHLGSLLPLGRETRVLVPAIGRENIFSTDCALRLRQLGFSRVEPVRWGESRTVGDLEITALPFYGEQPTSSGGVHPGLFNEGNTWRVRTPRFSAAFFADAGRDGRGDMGEVCDRVRKEGGVDVLFCGIRGFRLAPIFFGFTTLEAYLVDVPLAALTTPQALMATAEEALFFGARLGARHVVPCADGGAPWYFREGMGPRYPGYPGAPVEGASALEENPDADPFPERLAQVQVQSPGEGLPNALLMRPGEAFEWSRGAPHVRSFPPFRWPFGGRPD